MIIIPDGTNQGHLHFSFYLGVPARRRKYGCRRAVGLYAPMAGKPAISASIPHACSSDPTPVSRRTSCFLVSTFSRAAIFSRAPSFPGVKAREKNATTSGRRRRALETCISTLSPPCRRHSRRRAEPRRPGTWRFVDAVRRCLSKTCHPSWCILKNISRFSTPFWNGWSF